MEARLKAYGVAYREANPKAATLHLPSGGRVKTSKPSKPWAIELDGKGDDLKDWALAMGYAPFLRPALSTLSAIRDEVTVVEKDDGPPTVVYEATGEPVPGLVAVPTEVTATVVPPA